MWLPESGWKKQIDETVPMIKGMYDAPFRAVKDNLKSGTARPSVVANLIERHLPEGKTELAAADEDDIRVAANSFNSAGLETMITTMQIFTLAMLMHPYVFVKAQEEMDRVVGSGRLPELYDRENLPYLNAVIKETYRWHPAIPLGVPHASSEEDEFNGFRVPKETMVIGNLWGMSRDEDVYPEAEAFQPERFMEGSTLLGPKLFVFGFGRRIFPGKDFADACIYMVVANIVATMDIFRAKDERGEEIVPQAIFVDGFARYVH